VYSIVSTFLLFKEVTFDMSNDKFLSNVIKKQTVDFFDEDNRSNKIASIELIGSLPTREWTIYFNVTEHIYDSKFFSNNFGNKHEITIVPNELGLFPNDMIISSFAAKKRKENVIRKDSQVEQQRKKDPLTKTKTFDKTSFFIEALPKNNEVYFAILNNSLPFKKKLDYTSFHITFHFIYFFKNSSISFEYPTSFNIVSENNEIRLEPPNNMTLDIPFSFEQISFKVELETLSKNQPFFVTKKISLSQQDFYELERTLSVLKLQSKLKKIENIELKIFALEIVLLISLSIIFIFYKRNNKRMEMIFESIKQENLNTVQKTNN